MKKTIIICIFILFISTSKVFAEETYKGIKPPSANQVIGTFRKHSDYPKNISFIALAEVGEENYIYYTVFPDHEEEFIHIFKLKTNEWAFNPLKSKSYILVEDIKE